MKFTVFISEHCPSCPDALAVARKVRERFPEVQVETFNVDIEKPRPKVFAVPTYMLNGDVVFLGNPTDEQLEDLFSTACRSF